MRWKIVLIPVIVIAAIIGLVLTSIIVYNYYQSATIKPLVKISKTTYDRSTVMSTFGNHPKFDEFNEDYGPTYTDSLRKAAISSIREQAEDQGEDPEVILRCLDATGITGGDSWGLPSVAEKGFYRFHTNLRGRPEDHPPGMNETDRNNTSKEPCWIFVINWGVGGEPLGHIKVYVISTIDYTRLFYVTCD